MCILPLAFPPPLIFETFIFIPLHLFSGVEKAMKGVAPADQSAEEGSKGTSTVPTSSPSCPPDIFQSPPPYSPLIVPLHSSPPTIFPITISPDIPIRVEYLPDSVTVPSPIFLQGYSPPMSTLSSTSLSTSQTFSNITNSTTISLPDQDVSHLASLPRPTPILGSFSISPQTLSYPYPSNSSSLDVIPPLSSSIIHDQVLSSCSFAPSIVIPPSVLTSSPFHNTSFPRKSRGGCLVKGKSSWGHSPRGRLPRGGGKTQGSFPHLLILVQVPAISLFPSLYLSLPRDTFLRRGHWTYLLNLGSVITFPILLQSTHSLPTTPALPKSFLP